MLKTSIIKNLISSKNIVITRLITCISESSYWYIPKTCWISSHGMILNWHFLNNSISVRSMGTLDWLISRLHDPMDDGTGFLGVSQRFNSFRIYSMSFGILIMKNIVKPSYDTLKFQLSIGWDQKKFWVMGGTLKRDRILKYAFSDFLKFSARW